MILDFSLTHKNDKTKETHFKEKILSGSKIHTIREDKNRRWKKGNLIHFRINHRTPETHQFQFGKCTATQLVFIDPDKKEIYLEEKLLDKKDNPLFAKNDGFDSEADFWKWFKQPFNGVVIYWTNFIYQ